jgi:hypothetical protein
LKFAVLFLVGETDALNPAVWGKFNRTHLRPLSMVPWIYCGLPFFLVGVGMLFRRRRPRKVFASESLQRHDSKTGEDSRRRETNSMLILVPSLLRMGLGGLRKYDAMDAPFR